MYNAEGLAVSLASRLLDGNNTPYHSSCNNQKNCQITPT